jgi:BirA family transcriptional regulator, biotin operon repressor / biotin---[acetyl-CoA-carboxylase] ligase
MDPAASRGEPDAGSPIRHVAREVVGSTNSEALALARAGEPAPFWMTAGAQTAGRGRRGRGWASPPGNLYATLLLRDPSPAPLAPQLSFVAALAVHDAITTLDTGEAPLLLKWPNDVLYRGAKLAGVLIEGEGAPLLVAIGIGINASHHPRDADHPATDLRTEGMSVTPTDLFTALAGAMARRLRQWDRGAGFAGTRTDWLARAHAPGSELRVRLPEREFSGRFQALDEFGRLLLRLPDGTIESITAGDVFPIGRTAGAAAST